MTKNIIITGGAGFIGYHLANKLSKKNFNIYIMDNLSRGKYDKEFKKLLKNKNVNFIKIDLRKKIKIKIKPHYIYHLAGSVGVSNIKKDSFGSFLNNILTFKNVIDFNNNFKKKAKLILFSTSEVYSTIIKNKLVKFPIKENNQIIIENEVIDRDAYFLSKLFNEKLIQFSKSEYLILRPHNIYGPRMGYNHVVPELIEKIFKEKINLAKKTTVHSPEHKRAFCYVDDAINQIVNLSMNKKIKNDIFNIGNMREEIKILNLAKKIKNIIFPKSKLIKGKITEGSPKRRVPDMTKTLKRIKVSNFVNINQGLKNSANWYLANLEKKYD